MASLNQLISEFAHAVGNPNSIPLRRNLRYAILHGRNELIRKSYENHKYVDKGLQQRIRVSIINVPDGDLYNSQTLGLPVIKRTKQEVPKPVRLINNLIMFINTIFLILILSCIIISNFNIFNST